MGTCSGLACAVPGQHVPTPGPCTPAQQAAGGWEISTVLACAGSLEGVCKCYLPPIYQITQQNCVRVIFSSVPWEEPVAIASSATCATSVGPMTPATFPKPHTAAVPSISTTAPSSTSADTSTSAIAG